MSDEFEHRFIPGALASAPTILAVQGQGADQIDLLPLARMIDGDAAILNLVSGLKEKRTLRLFRRRPGAVFDREGLRAETAALAEFVRAASARHHFTHGRLVGFGFSGGATLAGSLLFDHPDALAGAILVRPGVPFEPEPRPDLAGKPVLIAGGRKDRGSRAGIERLADLLRACGADVTVHWHDAGHALSPSELEAISRWWAATFNDQGSETRP